jgi:peptidoglycan hydrolase-like protein with peptidoglycan-binding domain
MSNVAGAHAPDSLGTACGHAIAALVTAIVAALIWAAPADAKAGLTRNQVFELQFRLDQMKFDAGRPDGVAGHRTERAAAAAMSQLGLSPDTGPETLLSELRKATASMEGILLPDGRRQLLVFTDQGTPLILTMVSFGRMSVDEAGSYVRDHDVDGSPIYSDRADTSIRQAAEMPLLPGIAFGYEVEVPAPPRNERLEIEAVTVWPGSEAEADRSDDYSHVYLKKVSNPRYWWWQFDDDVSDVRQGLWRMSLVNRGDRIVSRQIMIGKPGD